MRIKELREHKNITQLELANEIGTSQRNISRWENNTNEPTMSFLINLANYFNCSIDYLVEREDDFGNIKITSDLTNNEKELLDLYRQLPEIRQEVMLDTFRGQVKILRDTRLA